MFKIGYILMRLYLITFSKKKDHKKFVCKVETKQKNPMGLLLRFVMTYNVVSNKLLFSVIYNQTPINCVINEFFSLDSRKSLLKMFKIKVKIRKESGYLYNAHHFNHICH